MTKTARSPRLPAALALTAACSLLVSAMSVPEAYAIDADTCGALMGTYAIVPYNS